MRGTRSSNLVDYGNLIDKLEIGSGVTVELIHFIVWDAIYKLFWCDTTKLFIKEESRFGSGVSSKEVYVGSGVD